MNLGVGCSSANTLFSEINLVLKKANKRIAIEFKVSTSPTVSKGFYNALKDIEAAEAWIIGPLPRLLIHRH